MVSAERGFLPETVDIHLFDQGIDLFTLETQRNVNEFDIVAFSVPFEGDYINVLRMLKLAKIPLRSAERSEHHPIVIAGGMAGLLNPEPLAPFIDVFAIGEGEHITGEIYEVIVDGQNESKTKAQVIEALSEIEGIYVPSMFEPAYNSDGTLSGYSPELYVKKRFVSDLDSHGAGSAVITKNTTFSDMHLVEVSRGCGGACRFCAAHFIISLLVKCLLTDCLRESLPASGAMVRVFCPLSLMAANMASSRASALREEREVSTPIFEASAVITKNTTFSDMHLIEVSRGCGGACRFCAEGFVYRYPRHRSKESILKEIRLAKAIFSSNKR